MNKQAALAGQWMWLTGLAAVQVQTESTRASQTELDAASIESFSTVASESKALRLLQQPKLRYPPSKRLLCLGAKKGPLEDKSCRQSVT